MDNRGGWIDGNAKCEDNESFEYMRRKLWCDVTTTAMGKHKYTDPAGAANAAVDEFDRSFGKGDGE